MSQNAALLFVKQTMSSDPAPTVAAYYVLLWYVYDRRLQGLIGDSPRTDSPDPKPLGPICMMARVTLSTPPPHHPAITTTTTCTAHLHQDRIH